jgi:hypothetical protein
VPSEAASYEIVAMVMVMVIGLATFGSLDFPGQFLYFKKKQQFMEPQCEIMLALIHGIFLRLYNVSFF